MKHNIFRMAAMSVLLWAGTTMAQAQQRSYECPPLDPEQQAMAAEVNQLNMEDPEKANKTFMKLFKQIRKSKEDLVAVGTYFLENDNYPAASQCSKEVYKLAPTYATGLMFAGEVFMKAQRWGEAGQKFDEVLVLYPDNVDALKRNAFVYKNVNPYAAIDALDKIKAIDPSSVYADKEKGDIYYKQDDYKKAVEFYSVYYNATPKDAEHLDIASCENYLQSLFSMSAQDETHLDKIIEVAAVLRPLAPQDIVIRRMDFFAKCTKIGTAMDYDGAMKAAEEAAAYIQNKEFADSLYLYLDYDFVAKLVREQGNNEQAIRYYTLAADDLAKRAADPEEEARKKEGYVASEAQCYSDISTLYVRLRNPEKSIEAYEKYLSLKGDKADNSDRYMYGTRFMAAYQQDSISAEQKKAFADKATEVFNGVIAAEAENPLPKIMSYQQLARLNNTDSNTPNDVVRDYYLKVLEMSEADDVKSKAANSRFEACRYLFFYYVAIPTPNKEEATKYATIAKEINPDDGFVQAAFEHIATM